MDLVSRGKANKEVAFELGLTTGTIKEYLHRVFIKVGVASRMELALREVELRTDEDATLP